MLRRFARHAVCPGRSTADRRPCPPATQGLCPWSAHTSRRGDWRTMEVQPLRSCGGRYAFPQRLPLPPLRPCGRGDICLEDGNPCPSRRSPLPGVITLRRTATITPRPDVFTTGSPSAGVTSRSIGGDLDIHLRGFGPMPLRGFMGGGMTGLACVGHRAPRAHPGLTMSGGSQPSGRGYARPSPVRRPSRRPATSRRAVSRPCAAPRPAVPSVPWTH